MEATCFWTHPARLHDAEPWRTEQKQVLPLCVCFWPSTMDGKFLGVRLGEHGLVYSVRRVYGCVLVRR